MFIELDVRAGKSGKAYTFCSEQDVYNLPAIERYIEMQIPSSVAYPEQMEEDKSAGQYIKTENWHGDDDLDNRHGYKKARNGDYHNKSYKNDRKGDYHKKSYGNKSSDKDDYKKSSDYHKKPYNKGKGNYQKGERKPYIDPAKLAGLSSEERMKLYKEAYASSSNSSNNYKKNNRDYKKNKNYQKGEYKKNSNNKNGKSYNNKTNNKPAAAKKVSFWQKLKSLFGGKK